MSFMSKKPLKKSTFGDDSYTSNPYRLERSVLIAKKYEEKDSIESPVLMHGEADENIQSPSHSNIFDQSISSHLKIENTPKFSQGRRKTTQESDYNKNSSIGKILKPASTVHPISPRKKSGDQTRQAGSPYFNPNESKSWNLVKRDGGSEKNNSFQPKWFNKMRSNDLNKKFNKSSTMNTKNMRFVASNLYKNIAKKTTLAKNIKDSSFGELDNDSAGHHSYDVNINQKSAKNQKERDNFTIMQILDDKSRALKKLLLTEQVEPNCYKNPYNIISLFTDVPKIDTIGMIEEIADTKELSDKKLQDSSDRKRRISKLNRNFKLPEPKNLTGSFDATDKGKNVSESLRLRMSPKSSQQLTPGKLLDESFQIQQEVGSFTNAANKLGVRINDSLFKKSSNNIQKQYNKTKTGGSFNIEDGDITPISSRMNCFKAKKNSKEENLSGKNGGQNSISIIKTDKPSSKKLNKNLLLNINISKFSEKVPKKSESPTRKSANSNNRISQSLDQCRLRRISINQASNSKPKETQNVHNTIQKSLQGAISERSEINHKKKQAVIGEEFDIETSIRAATYNYKFDRKDAFNGDSIMADHKMRTNPGTQTHIMKSHLEIILQKLVELGDVIHKEGVYDKIILVYKDNVAWVRKLNKKIEDTLAMIEFSSKLLFHGLLASLKNINQIQCPLDNYRLYKKKSEQRILRQNFQLMAIIEDYFGHIANGFDVISYNPQQFHFKDNTCLLLLITMNKIRLNCNKILQQLKVFINYEVKEEVDEPITFLGQINQKKNDEQQQEEDKKHVSNPIITELSGVSEPNTPQNICNSKLSLITGKKNIDCANNLKKINPGLRTIPIGGSSGTDNIMNSTGFSGAMNPQKNIEKPVKYELVETDNMLNTQVIINKQKVIKDRENFQMIMEHVRIFNKKKFRYLGDEKVETVYMHKHRREGAMLKQQKQFNKAMDGGEFENELEKKKKGESILDLKRVDNGLRKILYRLDDDKLKKKRYGEDNDRIMQDLKKIIN